MRLAAALATLLLLAACAGPGDEPVVTPTPPSTGTNPTGSGTVLFLLVESKHWVNRTSGSGGTYGETGGHCDNADYTTQPVTLDLVERGDAPPPRKGAVAVRHYTKGAENPPMATLGNGDVYAWIDTASGSHAVSSSFDGQRLLLQLEVQSGRVTVNGTHLAPGTYTHHTFEHTWTESSGGQSTTFHAVEKIAVKHLGSVTPAYESQGMCI